MGWTLLSIMVVLLLLGFPMMIPLIAGAGVGFYVMFGGMGQMETMIQQMMAGIRPASLIAVPMFIFAADIMTRGQSAGRLIDLVMSFVGHLRGGLAVATASACTMFGAVSGSTQATVVAIGSPLRPRMLKAGYKDSFILALIINASDIAFLIPPSIGMIIYGVVSNTSIAELFIAGIGPGLLILMLFSVYSWIYAVRHNVPTEDRATWAERLRALRSALWPMGFPAIIIGDGQTVRADLTYARRHVRVVADLHAWTIEGGLALVKGIAGAIEATLRTKPALTSHHLVDVRVSGTRYLRDPAGEHGHAVVSIEALLEDIQ